MFEIIFVYFLSLISLTRYIVGYLAFPFPVVPSKIQGIRSVKTKRNSFLFMK